MGTTSGNRLISYLQWQAQKNANAQSIVCFIAERLPNHTNNDSGPPEYSPAPGKFQ